MPQIHQKEKRVIMWNVFNICVLYVAFHVSGFILHITIPYETYECYFYKSSRDSSSHMNMTHHFKYREIHCECGDSLQPRGCMTHKHKARVVNHETSDSKLIIFVPQISSRLWDIISSCSKTLNFKIPWYVIKYFRSVHLVTDKFMTLESHRISDLRMWLNCLYFPRGWF